MGLREGMMGLVGTGYASKHFFDLGGGSAVIWTKNKGTNRRTNKKPYFLYYRL
jgi:hypothetical protein